jgi:hypothetical protein
MIRFLFLLALLAELLFMRLYTILSVRITEADMDPVLSRFKSE